MTASVTAWIPPTSVGLPVVCGASGFGPGVIERQGFDWSAVTDRFRVPYVMLVGSPGRDRTAAKDALIDSYLSSHPGSTVRYVDEEQVNAEAFREEWREAHRTVRTRKEPPRLVVLSLDESSGGEPEWDYRLAYFGQSIVQVGRLVGYSLLVVPPAFHVDRWRSAVGHKLTEAFVLEEVTPLPEAGHAIATGLREKVSSPAGFAALLEGAPVEWARSFGSASVV